MRRLIVVLVATVTSLAVAVPAGAGDAHTAPGLPVYLALGNSLAAGSGASDPATTAYVPLFHDALQDELDCLPANSDRARSGCKNLQLVNLAQGGATSFDLIDVQLPTAVAELSARNGDANPRNDVEVVTVDIGGNDLFDPVLAACAEPPATDCATVVASVFGAFWVNFNLILGQLREAAGPDTPIIVMTYHNSLLNPSCEHSGVAFLADLVLEGGGPVPAGGFNGLISAIAAAHGAEVADTFGELEADDLTGDCLHPNDNGHAIIAGEFLAAFES